jgi:predicted nucleic acid-binding protein
MRVLLDTNIMARCVEPGHTQFQVAIDAVAALRAKQDVLCLVPQVVYEFWVVGTRPIAVNGLGRTAAEMAGELLALRKLFVFLDDVPGIFAQWEKLVTTTGILGKGAHDARLVASMLVHGVTHLLTFNDQDFARFPGITVLTPKVVLSPPPTP